MEDPVFRAGLEQFTTVRQYVYQRIRSHIDDAIFGLDLALDLDPETLSANRDRLVALMLAGERTRTILDSEVYPPRNGSEHPVQLLLWRFLRSLVYDSWELLTETDREHDLEYLADLLIGGFEEPLLFEVFFNEESSSRNPNHEKLIHDLVYKVGTGDLDALEAARILPYFVVEWDRLYHDWENTRHANRFMGRDPEDRREHAQWFRMTSCCYAIALLHVLSERAVTKWNVPRLSPEPNMQVWINLQRVVRSVLHAAPSPGGAEPAPIDLDLRLSAIAPLVQELLDTLSPQARAVLISTRRFTETFNKLQQAIVDAENLRARIPRPTGMDLIKLEIAEARARRGQDLLLEVSDVLSWRPEPVAHMPVEGDCTICRIPLANDPEDYDEDVVQDVSKVVPLLFCPNCGKPFHEKCIFEWLDHCVDNELQETCPNCRGIWLN